MNLSIFTPLNFHNLFRGILFILFTLLLGAILLENIVMFVLFYEVMICVDFN